MSDENDGRVRERMMKNFNDFGQFDLGDFMKQFKQPTNANQSSFELDFGKVEEFIQNSMNEVLASTQNVSPNLGTSGNNKKGVFETHDYMIVKIPISEKVNIHDVNVFFDTNTLMIVGLSDKNEYITLPMNGSFSGSQGYYKDEIIEIRIPKNEKKNYKEIMIKHL